MAEPYTKIQNRIWDGLGRLNVSKNSYMVLSVIIRNTLCFHRNQQELSNGFLEKATGLSERSVIRAIRELERRGIIKIVSPSCGSHPRLVRIYPDKIDTLTKAQGHPDKNDSDNPDKNDSDNPDKNDSEEIKEKIKEEIKEKERKDSFSSIEEATAYYEAHPELWEDEI